MQPSSVTPWTAAALAPGARTDSSLHRRARGSGRPERGSRRRSSSAATLSSASPGGPLQRQPRRDRMASSSASIASSTACTVRRRAHHPCGRRARVGARCRELETQGTAHLRRVSHGRTAVQNANLRNGFRKSPTSTSVAARAQGAASAAAAGCHRATRARQAHACASLRRDRKRGATTSCPYGGSERRHFECSTPSRSAASAACPKMCPGRAAA